MEVLMPHWGSGDRCCLPLKRQYIPLQTFLWCSARAHYLHTLTGAAFVVSATFRALCTYLLWQFLRGAGDLVTFQRWTDDRTHIRVIVERVSDGTTGYPMPST